MGNIFRSILYILIFFSPNSYTLSCYLKVYGTGRIFSLDGNFTRDEAFHFQLSVTTFPGKYTALHFQFSQAYNQGCYQGNKPISPLSFPPGEDLGRSPALCLQKEASLSGSTRKSQEKPPKWLTKAHLLLIEPPWSSAYGEEVFAGILISFLLQITLKS